MTDMKNINSSAANQIADSISLTATATHINCLENNFSIVSKCVRIFAVVSVTATTLLFTICF